VVTRKVVSGRCVQHGEDEQLAHGDASASAAESSAGTFPTAPWRMLRHGVKAIGCETPPLIA
jgi:hypothetical protein